jgi:hypothetical protein
MWFINHLQMRWLKRLLKFAPYRCRDREGCGARRSYVVAHGSWHDRCKSLLKHKMGGLKWSRHSGQKVHLQGNRILWISLYCRWTWSKEDDCSLCSGVLLTACCYRDFVRVVDKEKWIHEHDVTQRDTISPQDPKVGGAWHHTFDLEAVDPCSCNRPTPEHFFKGAPSSDAMR